MSMGLSGGARKPTEISMNPRNLANFGSTTPAVYLGESELLRPNPVTYHPQVRLFFFFFFFFSDSVIGNVVF